jgi:hypothetical protein
MLAEAAVVLRDTESATALYESLGRHRAAVGTIGGYMAGPAAYFRGILAAAVGQPAAAIAHFEEAIAVGESMQALPWLARTRLAWARTLAGRGGPEDAEQARDLAAQALATAERLGMARIAEAARALVS